MKKQIWESIYIHIDGKDIEEIIDILEPYKVKENAYISIDNEYDIVNDRDNPVFYINYQRLETDSEEIIREEKEKQEELNNLLAKEYIEINGITYKKVNETKNK